MNYGKNQLALLKFLEKYPNRWHRVKRIKAVKAAIELSNKRKSGVSFMINQMDHICARLDMPQMLIKQN